MALKSKARSSFVYKPRSADQIKGRANRKSSKFDSIFKQGFDTYRPKQGDNLFRYLPPTWDDSDHYGYTAFVHRNIGPDNATYLCPRKMLNKPCPICEAQKEAKDAGESEEATALTVGERVISWVIDRDADDPEKPLIYDMSWTQDRDIVSLCLNERTGEILMIDHPDKGYDVTIKRTGTGLKTKYFGYAIAREDSPIADSEKAQDEILEYIKENPIPDTLNFFDYDYLKGVLSGTVAEKDSELDKKEDEDETPPARKSSRRAAAEEEEEAPFEKPTRRGPRRDEEESYEEEDPPPRKPAGRRAADPEDEGDEPPPRKPAGRVRQVVEEEEEAPPPRTARRAREVVEEEEDAPPPRSNARSRVVEEDEEEDDAPPARSERRSPRGR